jgi:glycosyltransferase involved in cell wall biosynthesis
LIVSVGRLVPYKGHQRVIAALPKVVEHIPDARLRIVGTGPYEPALRKMARKLGVADRVEFGAVQTGDWRDMVAVLERADLVTLLSEYESQAIAVWDALALRRPVLVASTSALQQLADRDLVRAVPLHSSPEAVATAIASQLRRPLVPPDVAMPTWDDCAASVLALYQDFMRSTPCAS